MLKFIAAVNRYGSWILAILTLLFVFTGLAMTKRIWDPPLCRQLHEHILPLPFYVLFLAHVFFPIRTRLIRWALFKNEKTATAYAYAVCGTLLTLILWFHFR